MGCPWGIVGCPWVRAVREVSVWRLWDVREVSCGVHRLERELFVDISWGARGVCVRCPGEPMGRPWPTRCESRPWGMQGVSTDIVGCSWIVVNVCGVFVGCHGVSGGGPGGVRGVSLGWPWNVRGLSVSGGGQSIGCPWGVHGASMGLPMGVCGVSWVARGVSLGVCGQPMWCS